MVQVPQLNSGVLATLTAYMYYLESIMRGVETISEIVPGKLYLGSIAAAFDQSLLTSHKITHILSVTQFGEAACWFPNDFTYCYIDIQDSVDVDIQLHFSKCITFIQEALELGGCVFVHCNQGRSRSVSVTTAYLCATDRCTIDEALLRIQAKRSVAEPNKSFLCQLHNWENNMKNEQNPSIDCVSSTVK